MEREGKGRLWRALHRWPLHPVRWLRGGGRVSRLDLLAYRSYRREYWADGTKVGTQCAGGRDIHKHCCTFTYITYIKVHTNTQAWYTHTHTHARTQTHMCTHARTHHTHTHTTQLPTVGVLLLCRRIDRAFQGTQVCWMCRPNTSPSAVPGELFVCITLLSIHLSLHCKV